MRFDNKKYITKRIRFLGWGFFLIFLIIGGKAFYYQVVISEWLSEKALRQYEKEFVYSGKRGAILDASGRNLAVSIDAESIGAHPKQIKNLAETAKILSDSLSIPKKDLVTRLSSAKQPFVWIKRKVTSREVSLVKAFDLPGVVFKSEHKRYYPNKFLAAQILGFVDMDNKGLAGIELTYDEVLKGYQDSIKVRRDALGNSFEAEKAIVPDYNGNNLILTIDAMIQYSAEKALASAVTEFGAQSGMVLVMSPRTGDILAMAHYPFYNLNAHAEFDKNLWRVRSVTDPFEPGSTMKIFSAAAAIESGTANSQTQFFCENGAYRIGRNTVHDTHSYGTLTLQEIVKYSSNIGAIKVGQFVGEEILYKNLKNFGFGDKTGLALSGETSGILAHFKKWRKIDAGTIAFGQGISVSAIQMVAATGALANGGSLMKPQLIKAIVDQDGKIVQEFKPVKIRQACSPKTAATIREMMKEVITTGGTGTNAAMEGYTVCGKTGTAQKIINGAYARGKYVSSFIGFVPADRAEAVIMVIIDEPTKRHYGGTVAAPAFKKIALEMLGYLNIPPENMNNRFTVALQREAEG
jgi:cell division protein FtsI (penicillin-binding protein 3)